MCSQLNSITRHQYAAMPTRLCPPKHGGRFHTNGGTRSFDNYQSYVLERRHDTHTTSSTSSNARRTHASCMLIHVRTQETYHTIHRISLAHLAQGQAASQPMQDRLKGIMGSSRRQHSTQPEHFRCNISINIAECRRRVDESSHQSTSINDVVHVLRIYILCCRKATHLSNEIFIGRRCA